MLLKRRGECGSRSGLLLPLLGGCLGHLQNSVQPKTEKKKNQTPQLCILKRQNNPLACYCQPWKDFFLSMPTLLVPGPRRVVWVLFPLNLKQYWQTPLSSSSVFCGDKKTLAYSYEEACYSANSFSAMFYWHPSYILLSFSSYILKDFVALGIYCPASSQWRARSPSSLPKSLMGIPVITYTIYPYQKIGPVM